MTPARLVAACCLLLAPSPLLAAELQDALKQKLPLLGHRNWVVIADSAYPAQSRPGIETVYVGGDQIETVKAVLQTIRASRHVRPKVLLDAELAAVSEQDAPGVSRYREELGKLLEDCQAERIPHETIIDKLDEAAKTFQILILKTDLTIPYTTVFLELDCAYWNAEAEQRLRRLLSAGESR